MKTINYQEQAEQFIKSVGATMSISYHSYGKHFEDDKQERNIYLVMIKRNDKRYTFRFGDSIANTNSGDEPTVYDVLACLTKDEVGTFEDFCANFGYSDDSIKAKKTYLAVKREFEGVKRVFGDVLEQLQEIN